MTEDPIFAHHNGLGTEPQSIRSRKSRTLGDKSIEQNQRNRSSDAVRRRGIDPVLPVSDSA
jgi:hypothetical protein